MRAWGGFVQELTVEWIGRERIDLDRVRTAMVATLPILVDQVLPLIDRGDYIAGLTPDVMMTSGVRPAM